MPKQKIYIFSLIIILVVCAAVASWKMFGKYFQKDSPKIESTPEVNVPIPITVSSPLGSYDIISFSLWPESGSKSQVLFDDDRIIITGFATSTQPKTLGVKYEFTSLDGGTMEKEDMSFLILDANGNGEKIISSSTPAGVYRFKSIKTSDMKDWIDLKKQLEVSVKPLAKIKLEKPVIKYIDLKGGKKLKPGDQYAVKVLNGAKQEPLKDVVLDAVYMSSDENQPQVAERWVRLNSEGIGLVTLSKEMPAGGYNIISVKIHEI